LEALITTWLAALGLSVGSFLNVVIARVPHDESIVRPRSKCPRCGHQLPWYENIPVVSWLLLRGRCSGCKAPISPRYILVELLTGTLFVACIPRYGLDWELVSALVFISLLIPLIFIDAEHWILPFELTLPGIAAGVLLAVPRGQEAVETAVVGAVAAFLTFRVLEFLGWAATGREALGAGDKYLLAMIGAQFGWKSLLGVILLSSLQGSVVGLVRLKLTGRAGPEKPAEEPAPAETPLGPDGERGEPEEEAPAREPFTPEFLKPGLPFWKRLVLVPFTIFLQDIPDSPPPDDETGDVPEWEPQANNMPFGPWIGLAGLEVMLLGPWLVAQLAHSPYRLLAEIVFGQ
jgi:leader peptidase (prepilin peptidase)/N-methyltransferase